MFCVCFTSALGAFMAVVWWSQSALSHVFRQNGLFVFSFSCFLVFSFWWLHLSGQVAFFYVLRKLYHPLFLEGFQFIYPIFFNYRWNRWTFPDLLAIESSVFSPWRFHPNRWKGLLNDRSSSWNINLCWTLPN